MKVKPTITWYVKCFVTGISNSKICCFFYHGLLLFHSTTSIRWRTLKHLFATLHVRWLSRIFNHNAWVYQTTTRWDLPPYRITIWFIDWWCNVSLFTWWIDSLFLLQRFDMGNWWIWTRINYHPCITSKTNKFKQTWECEQQWSW